MDWLDTTRNTPQIGIKETEIRITGLVQKSSNIEEPNSDTNCSSEQRQNPFDVSLQPTVDKRLEGPVGAIRKTNHLLIDWVSSLVIGLKVVDGFRRCFFAFGFR